MNIEVKFMLKKVIIFNLIISILIALLLTLFTGRYAFLFLLGSTVGIINFIVHSIVVNLSLSSDRYNKGLLTIGFIFRVISVYALGIYIILKNPYNIIPYILGYASQFLGIIVYGIIGGKKQ